MQGQDITDPLVVRIPLRTHKGVVRAYALIDAADFPLVAGLSWHLDGLGYATTCFRTDGKVRNIKLHRLLLGLGIGDGRHVDHINRDRLDNRRANLRIVTKAQNAQNPAPYRNGRSAFRGVSWESSTRRWVATITIQRNQTKLGRFKSEEEAARMAREARERLMPFATD